MHKALYVLLISLGLALVFNILFFGKLIGISVLIFVGVLLGAVFLFGRYHELPFRKSWWLVALIVFFSLMPAVRANEFLTFLNVCAVFGLLMVLAHELSGTPVFLMKLRDYVALIILGPFRMIGRGLSAVALVGQIHSKVKDRDVLLRIIKGVVMALPILIVFGLLFQKADLAFAHFLDGFLNISVSERSMQYTVLLIFAFAASLSFLSYIFFPKEAKPLLLHDQQKPLVQGGREIEVLVFLGLIATLFLVFIGFQVTYLFGGETNIINTGFTYAEYARRGFWELLIAALLSLAILLAAEKYAGNELKQDKRFLVPALILITEVVIVIISAFKRLALYIDAYGMTSLRFYVAGFIGLLLVLFVILAVKFIKSKPEQFFAFSTLLAVAGFIMAVNVVNPDAFIAASNMERFKQTGKIDTLTIELLSADAEREKLELVNIIEGQDKDSLRQHLQEQRGMLEEVNAHWQSANMSRARALKFLKEYSE